MASQSNLQNKIQSEKFSFHPCTFQLAPSLPNLIIYLSTQKIYKCMRSCFLRLTERPHAAAAAKSLQPCPTLQPHRQQPTRLPHPWDSPGKYTGVGCHFLLQCMKCKVKGKSLSRVRLFATPRTAAYQAPLSMGFSRQEYWSGVPLPSPLAVLINI